MSGRWKAKAEREQEFVEAWSELASWSGQNVPGSGTARLLQSAEDPSVFAGFWSFANADVIRNWRETPGVQQRLGAIRELLDEAEPGIYELRVEVGPDARSG